MAEKSDIAFHLDETWQYDVTVADADKNPITNIVAAEWRIAKTSRVVYAELGDGITISGPGAVRIIVPSAAQADITPGQYQHELWIYDGSVESIQVCGTISVNNSLKRRFP